MKKLAKFTSTLLVISMVLSSIAYAGELSETESLNDQITFAISYGMDKIKNTVVDILSIDSEEKNDDNIKKQKFEYPGMELTDKDIKTLYDMGYSMLDISNAITLSEYCDETPYQILQIKGVQQKRNEQQTNLMSDNGNAENISEEPTWTQVKQNLNLSEDVKIDENSEIIYDGEPDDIETIFRQLGINEILKENNFQESEISESIESGVIESTNIDKNINEEQLDNNTQNTIFISNAPSDSDEIEPMSASNDDNNIVSLYNGSIYPMFKYDNEKTSGYSVESGVDINPVSGNLMTVENDLNLKGINGLDLNLNRVYSSERANMLDAVAKVTDETKHSKIGYYRINAAAEITITYRESTTNGGTIQTTKYSDALTLVPPQENGNSYIYSAVRDQYVDEQIDRGNISSLFAHSQEAEQARTDAYDGKYDKTISFKNGRIAQINISIVNDMDCITKNECFVTIPDIPYETEEQFVNKNRSFSDLGVGWEFDFPYIEIKNETRYIDYEEREIPYEYFHYGTKGTWCFEKSSTYSNLVGYYLKDMQLSYYNSKFDGRSTSYLLTEADGKKSYFGTRGELLGVEDRFGNQIRFYYGNNLHNYYVLNKIIDSVGREVTFDYKPKTTIEKYDNFTQSTIDVDRYTIVVTVKEPTSNTTKSITYTKDQIFGVRLTYTDIDGEEHTTDISDSLNSQPNPKLFNLTVVTDSEGLSTKYSYDNSYSLLSITDKNLEAHGTEIPYSYMNSISYPTGALYIFSKKDRKDNFGTDGIRGYSAYSTATLKNYYFNENTNKISNFNVSSKTIVHNNSIKETSNPATQLTTASGYPYYRNIKEIPSNIKYVVGIENKDFKKDGEKRLTTNSYIYQNDELLLADSTVEGVGTQIVDGITSYPAFMRTTTSYSYNNKNLCENQETKTFSDSENDTHNNYVMSKIQRTYDAWGNVLTETLNGDTNRKTTYTYNSTYHYPIKKEYKRDSDTTIVENYTPNTDQKTIKESTIIENNSTKKKSTYEYDTYGNVTKEIRYGVNGDMSQCSTTDYKYSDSDNIISNAYVTSANVSNLKDVDGMELSDVKQNIVYDCWGNVIKETDCNGNVYQYEYDKNNRLTKEINPDNSYKTYSYDIEYTVTSKIIKNQITETDENGKKIQHNYNSIGDLISEYNVTDNKKMLSYEYAYKNGKDIIQTYSNVNNSSETVTSYDALGRKLSSEVIDNDGNTISKQTYEYEVLPTEKQFKTITTIIGDTTEENVKNIQYTDIYGNVVKEETVYNEDGAEKIATTEYTYDYLGNVKTVREPRAKDENWAASQYTAQYDYDVFGNVIKETDINGKSIVNTYDGLGNLISVKDKNGNKTTNTYDNLGRLLQEQNPFQKAGTNTIYATNKYYYDGNGNVIKSQTANNATGSSSSYTTTEYQYNWQNQPTKVIGYDGDNVANSVLYYYDSVGNLRAMFTGDVANATAYASNDIVNAGDYAVTKYTYDSMNRCITQTDALGQTITNTYDINGNLIKTIDRNGNTLNYIYDGLNQLTQKSSSKTGDDTYTYAYNKKGNRTSMSGGGVNTTYNYNNLGQLAKETLTNGIVKEYTYDMNGNRKSFQLKRDNSIQYTLTYDYDKRNQLTKVYEDGTVKAEYTYNPDGTLKKSSYGSQTTEYTYNLANLLTEVNNSNGSTQISKYSYTYYVDGNQKSKFESVAGIDKGTTTYTYDGLNRLVQEQTPDNTYSYQYDIYGNRSRLTRSSGNSVEYTYDKNNRLIQQVDGDKTTKFWYDPNGNQISSMTTHPSTKYVPEMKFELVGEDTSSYSEYDSWNQLTKTMQNGKTASYTYNGDGLRMSKTVDGKTTKHIWDGTDIVGDVTDGTVTKYIRGLQLISSKNGSNENFYTYNGHGDVVQLTNSTGAITKQYNYDAFGVETNKTNNDTNPFRYCGEYYDIETDSVYLRARYYRTTTGQFISEDPIQSRVNWYNYCDGNPISRIDPTGEKWFNLDDAKKFISFKINYLSWCVDILNKYGSNINNIIGVSGFYYAESQGIFYSHINAWQRDWGYNNFYDWVAERTLNIEYIAVFFEYGERTWRIEFWKGDYGPTIGAEVGVYYNNPNIPGHYDSVDNSNLLKMSMNLSTKDGEQLFSRSPVETWWLTGFKIHSDLDSSDLELLVRICFKDSAMRNEFQYNLTSLNDDSITYEAVSDTEGLIHWK